MEIADIALDLENEYCCSTCGGGDACEERPGTIQREGEREREREREMEGELIPECECSKCGKFKGR